MYKRILACHTYKNVVPLQNDAGDDLRLESDAKRFEIMDANESVSDCDSLGDHTYDVYGLIHALEELLKTDGVGYQGALHICKQHHLKALQLLKQCFMVHKALFSVKGMCEDLSSHRNFILNMNVIQMISSIV